MTLSPGPAFVACPPEGSVKAACPWNSADGFCEEDSVRLPVNYTSGVSFTCLPPCERVFMKARLSPRYNFLYMLLPYFKENAEYFLLTIVLKRKDRMNSARRRDCVREKRFSPPTGLLVMSPIGFFREIHLNWSEQRLSRQLS